MTEIINATDVRKDWGHFIDTVVHHKPQIVKRNRDLFAAFSLDQLGVILTPYRLTIDFEQESDGTVSGSFDQIDLAANAPDLETLKESLARQLIEYAQEYMNHFDKYAHSPNRNQHFPYMIHVLIQKDIQGVINLIDA